MRGQGVHGDARHSIDVVYRIDIDNDRDGKAEDVVYEFRFRTENRPIGRRGGRTQANRLTKPSSPTKSSA